jgi:hypothetical protein
MMHRGKKAAYFVWRKKKTIILSSIFCISLLAIFSYFTNPFTKYNVFNKHLVNVKLSGKQFAVETQQIYVNNNFWINRLALAKAGWHIFVNRLDPRITDYGDSYDEIVKNVHEYRFDPEFPFIISGEHFSVLYPRSLGIFYHSLLDPRTALSETDWYNRQYIYLKTLGFVLEVYNHTDRLSTTIVPMSQKSVSLINVYAPPSDTLYSILYALSVTRNTKVIQQTYPYDTNNGGHTLLTVQASVDLQKKYNDSLKRHVQTYRDTLVDPELGFIKKNITLSSTKDSVKRQSSFYDNVIYWRTLQLAQELELIPKDETQLVRLK